MLLQILCKAQGSHPTGGVHLTSGTQQQSAQEPRRKELGVWGEEMWRQKDMAEKWRFFCRGITGDLIKSAVRMV